MKQLEEFYHSRNQTSFPSSVNNLKSLTTESVQFLLKSCAHNLLGLETWSEQQNILDVGASSFDVVRLANYLEDKLKRFTLSSSDRATAYTAELVEHLLEKPLAQVAVYICSTYGRSEAPFEHNIRVSGLSESKEEERFVSSNDQKRASVAIGVHQEPPLKKPRRVDKVITSWRRGQCFINGKSVHSL